MTSQEALQAAIAASGKTLYAVSKAVGRSPSYAAQVVRQGARPTGETLALIGGACGYRLALVPCEHELPSGAIVID